MGASTEDLIQLHLEPPTDGAAPPIPQEAVNIDGFDVEGYLAEERGKDLLRFSTAGSVDDGKSTLIGRLLYDTQSVYDDQIRSIEGKGTTAPGTLDLALLTDGLRAEREQGITIDVAYRYFATARRKFIIADTPGHEQYTRNMATGASTADVAIVLIDARKGVLTQSRRHAYITSLLGVRQVIVAVNKMDLVGYAETVFEAIRSEFMAFYSRTAAAQGRDLRRSQMYFVPVSALVGDNVVHCTDAMPWYSGPSLLELLETVPAAEVSAHAAFRMSVQREIRPDQDFRGFAGQIASGMVHPGDAVVVLPSQRKTTVRSIVTFDGDLTEAQAPLSVSLTLEDEVDISRGDLLVAVEAQATTTSRFTATLVWMDERPMDLTRRYLLKHASRMVPSTVRALRYTVNITTLEEERGSTLGMNGIGVVDVETLQPLSIDAYADNRTTGSFVLIDVETNATVAAGMIRDVLVAPASAIAAAETGRVTAEERSLRWGHIGAHVSLEGTEAFTDAVERALFERGALVIRADVADAAPMPAWIASGALVLTLQPSLDERLGVQVGGKIMAVGEVGAGMTTAVSTVLDLLQTANVLRKGSGVR
jgi:sulfate adenylyltransferase large subunit